MNQKQCINDLLKFIKSSTTALSTVTNLPLYYKNNLLGKIINLIIYFMIVIYFI